MKGPKESAALLLLVLAAAFGCAPASAQRKALELEQGRTLGKPVFPAGDTAQGGNGRPVHGIEALGREMLESHYHAHLSLFHQGEQVAIPAAIGIVDPGEAQDGFVGSGRAIYWLHTHDASGIIHVESPDRRRYTLGDFFAIWGRPLGRAGVAGLEGSVRAYVNGKPFRGDPAAIVLKPHEEITLVVGEPAVTPPRYLFPKGL